MTMHKPCKILLSAYACEPNRGSEPGVGWHWALELSKKYQVWVLTRSNNKSSIDQYLLQKDENKNLHFIYYDLPLWILKLKKLGMSVNLYYLLWQIGVLKIAKINHNKFEFDLVHHLTFGVFRHPSFLYKLNIPFIFGPVGGGEFTPTTLQKSYPFKYRIIEFLRNAINQFSYYNPFLLKVYKKAILILVKTDQTKTLIPQKYLYKTFNMLEIGINNFDAAPSQKQCDVFKVLFVGRLIYWKGLDIALKGFYDFSRSFQGKTELIIVGKGEYKNRIKIFGSEYGIQNQIQIYDWMPQEDLKNIYKQCHVFLFPSLHDSSGNVVLEALSFGLPVICLDTGGPAAILGKDFDELIVNTSLQDQQSIIKQIKLKLIYLSNDKNFNYNSQLAIKRAKELTWVNTVSNVYQKIESVLQSHPKKW